MPDVEDLARRAVACRRWRWLPGMRLECGDILLWSDDQHWHCCGGNQNWIRWRHDRIGQAERGSLPDLTDPATLGCLLALVREAWANPRLVAIYCEAAHPGQSEGWAVQTADNRLPVAGEDYGSEAEALVAALEAAPVLGG